MLTIRQANQNDRVIIAEHLRHIALEVGFSENSIRQDWLEKTNEFIDRARQELRYKGFIAQIDGKIVGSVSCQILELYPMVSAAYPNRKCSRTPTPGFSKNGKTSEIGSGIMARQDKARSLTHFLPTLTS